MTFAFQQISHFLRIDRPLSSKRSLARPWKYARGQTTCRAMPEKRNDTRGHALPEPGQMVLTPGRWAGEDAAGLVEGVRYVETRGTHVVDVIEMRRISGDLFALGSRAKGTSSAKWYDVSDVRLVPTPEYISSQDAYRIPGARDGYAKVQPMDEQTKALADAEYKELKRYMLKVTASFGVLGTVGCAAVIGENAGRAFAYGAAASIVYLAMLQGSVDAVGEKRNFLKKVLNLRFIIPAIPFILLSKSTSVSGTSLVFLKSSISKVEVAALLVGLLSYKVPLLLKTGTDFIDGLAEIQPGTSGMLGTVASLAARLLQKRRDSNAIEEVSESSPEAAPPVIIFAGPSGAGKSTLMARLEADYPEVCGYSISHTTRERREGEEDGKDYVFVNDRTFQKMISDGSFVEYAEVHGQYYGTSFAAVNAVLSSNKACILDLDIQGIENLRRKQDLHWTPRLVWIAPPSLDVLQERLLSRGTETSTSLATRMNTAVREMTFAATNNIFDLTVINENLDSAYAEIAGFIKPNFDELMEKD